MYEIKLNVLNERIKYHFSVTKPYLNKFLEWRITANGIEMLPIMFDNDGNIVFITSKEMIKNYDFCGETYYTTIDEFGIVIAFSLKNKNIIKDCFNYFNLVSTATITYFDISEVTNEYIKLLSYVNSEFEIVEVMLFNSIDGINNYDERHQDCYDVCMVNEDIDDIFGCYFVKLFAKYL